MRTVLSTIFIFCVFLLRSSLVYSTTTDEFNSDCNNIINLQNKMVKDSISTLVTMGKIQPLMSTADSFSYSVTATYGGSLSPLYMYGLKVSDFGIFSNFNSIYPSNGELLQTINLGFDVGLGNNFLTTINFGYLPSLSFGSTKMNNFKASANLYYSLIQDTFFISGLKLGAGYAYSEGSVSHTLDLTYSDSLNTSTYKGLLNSNWGYHALSLSLFLNKSILIVNFYGRVDCYSIFGDVQSELSGSSSVAGNIDKIIADNTTGYGVVLSGGMEIAIGLFKLNVEGGRDMLTSSLYGDVGIRFGL